jgi:hypothetical protein
MVDTNSFFSKRCAACHGGGSDMEMMSKQWKSLWAVKALGKMKIVLWNIPANNQCIFFGCRSENLAHIFFECQFAQAVWEAVKMKIQLKLNTLRIRSMQQWLFEFLSKASSVQATTFAVTCWHVWEARNDARNDKGIIHPSRLVVKILVYVENIVQHCYKLSPASICEPSLRWVPPTAGCVCVNVDAGISRRVCFSSVL